MAFLAQLRLVLWKNALLKRRNVGSTLSELLLPLLFVALLVWLQTLDKDRSVAERDWTCPTQTAFSPTLLQSRYLEDKAINSTKKRKKDDEFFFSVDTEGAGAGMQTVPPLLYLLVLCAKTQSRIGLVASSPETRAWLEDFAAELDEFTKPLESPLWHGLREVLDDLDVPLCRFSRLVVFFDSSKEFDEYTTSPDYGEGEWNVPRRNDCPTDSLPIDFRTAKPRIYGAIELLHNNKPQFAYNIRMNVSVVPVTYTKVGLVEPLQVGVDAESQDMYAMSGFLTLQLQMDRRLLGRRLSPAQRKTPAFKRIMEHSVCDSLQPLIRQLSQLVKKPNLNRIDCIRLFNGLVLAGLDLTPLSGPASYAPHQVRVAPFPTPSYVDRPFYAKVEDVMSLVLLLCYLWPTSRLIRGLVHEKESRLKESMLQMGFSPLVVMVSWLVTYGIMFSLVALLITVVTRFNVFSKSDPTCVFTFFLLFGCDIVAYCFMVSVLFDRAKTASTVGTALFFMTYTPFFAVDNPNAPASAKQAAAIFAPTAFGIGTTVLAHYEAGNEGIHWWNARNAPAENDVAFASILMHFVVDFFVYCFLGWYLSEVVPSEFGVKRPWYFLCSWRYYCRGNKSTRSAAVTAAIPITDNNDDHDPEQNNTIEAAFIESRSSNVALARLETEDRCIRIQGLRKVFNTPSGAKVAVHGLDVTFYEGEIFVLLAQNGSGKTTTLKMLTGDLAPTSGTAQVFGMDIHTDMSHIRHSMGVCPQHDCLWEDLTVKEHLEFAASQKGLAGAKLEAAVREHIASLGLELKTNALASTLSGGQKRKLGLAMALIGNSKVVFLDEPTSGMDSHSRRFVWNLLQASKAGRIIVLTTHFLDEADFLGDQIGIMADGKMKCVGTSHFLKQKFGVGYTLTVLGQTRVSRPGSALGGGAPRRTPTPVLSAATSTTPVADGVSSTEASAAAVLGKVTDMVLSVLPSAKLLTAMGSETSYQVPFDAAALFPRLFEDLDRRKSLGEIAGYGVSVTTLDEVFVKVALGADDGQLVLAEKNRLASRTSSQHATSVPSSSSSSSSSSSYEPSSFATQFSTLVRKRAQYARRDKKSVCCSVLVPVLLLIQGLGMLKVFPLPEPPLLVLSERDALQTVEALQVVIDSSRYAPQDLASSPPSDQAALEDFSRHVRGGMIPTAYDFAPQPNNCTEDENGDLYVDARGTKRMSQFLRHDRFEYRGGGKPKSRAGRFGAIHFESLSRDFSQPTLVTIFANSSAKHSSGVYMSVMNQALLRMATQDERASIQTGNAPMKFTAKFQELVSTFSAVSASMSIIIAFSFVPATVAVFVVREREISAKHQQLLAGTNVGAYWLANFVFDVLMFSVPWLAGLVCVYAFGIDAFNHGPALVAVACLFLAYGLAVVPFTYLASFFFESHSTAQNVVLLFNFITGLVLMIASFVMSVIETTYKANRVLEYFYRIFPGFCLGNGLLNIAINNSKKVFGDGVLIKAESVFAWDVVGANLFYLVVESVAYFALTWALDVVYNDPFLKSRFDALFERSKIGMFSYSCCPCRWRRRSQHHQSQRVGDANVPLLGARRRSHLSGGGNLPTSMSSSSSTTFVVVDEDEDVVAETARVDANDLDDDEVVVVKHLRKVYPSTGLVAVNDLSFAIKRGEVFALLGVNGAGKSTTLKMLTGDVLPTSGTATLDGMDILLEQSRVRRLIGYCPQFDALLDLLTPREHLELFGRLKGIPEGELDAQVRRKLRELRLEEFEHRLAGTLSGGNKRKLSVAIALIGDPVLVFLDEATTGVDVLNRRFLCDVVADYSVTRKKGAVVMTTHSMEEVEALATRVGIISGGNLRCLGSIQHLKNRFGRGVMFRVRLCPPSPALVDALASKLLQRSVPLDSMDALQRACEIAGNGPRRELIHETDPTGWVIWSALDRDKAVDPRAFAQWWVAQDDSDRFEHFVEDKFKLAELLEKRPGQFVFRVVELEYDLKTCFAMFEEAKSGYGVMEYSISGTSLESIFISLAQQSTETR